MNSAPGPGRAIVVGGGVLGTMHAVEARGRGFDVVHLEREPDARGASVRNFGLVWVSGRAGGAELDLARRARQRWAQIAAGVPGVGFRPNGSLTLAADDTELGLLKEAPPGPTRPARLRTAGPRRGPRRQPGCARAHRRGAAVHADAIVEPSAVPAARRTHLLGAGGYRWLPGREAVATEPYGVRDHIGEWHRGDLVVVCSGAAYTGVAGPHLATYPAPPLRRVRLQMMQTRPFAGRLTTAIADGDSMRYYPAFDLPGRGRLRRPAPVRRAPGRSCCWCSGSTAA